MLARSNEEKVDSSRNRAVYPSIARRQALSSGWYTTVISPLTYTESRC